MIILPSCKVINSCKTANNIPAITIQMKENHIQI